MTFLELCKAYRAELGIPGSGPVTVVGQLGELARVVLDIQNADQDIKRQWQDWKFLWNTHASTTVAGGDRLASLKPVFLGTWDTRSAWVDKNTANPVHLEYVPYEEWVNDQEVGVPQIDTPYQFTFTPSGEIRIFPYSTSAQNFKCDYWEKAQALSGDIDVSVIPEEYHRLIVVRAKLIYAEREDAPEIMAGASAEYDSLMTNLEAGYLPNQGDGRQAQVLRPRAVYAE